MSREQEVHPHWSSKPPRMLGLLAASLLGVLLGLSVWIYSSLNPGVFRPAPLSDSHAGIKNCRRCHDPAGPGAETAIKTSADSRKSKKKAKKTKEIEETKTSFDWERLLTGFRAKDVADQTCESCHLQTPHHIEARFKPAPKSANFKKRQERYEKKLSAYQGKTRELRVQGCVSCHRLHTPGKTGTRARADRYTCGYCHGFTSFRLPEKGEKAPTKAALKRLNENDPTGGLVEYLFAFELKLIAHREKIDTTPHPNFRKRYKRRALDFNHRFHLEKLDREYYQKAYPRLARKFFRKDQTNCVFCHKFGRGKTNPVGVSFRRNCGACHNETHLLGLDHSKLRRKLDANIEHPALENCSVCHLTRDGSILKVRFYSGIYKKGKFTHAPHIRRYGCQTCHGGMKYEKFGSDFKVPGARTCEKCHNGQTAFDNCLECHTYHPGEHIIKPRFPDNLRKNE